MLYAPTMRLLYALYAFTVLFFAWRFHGETEVIDIARKLVIALWIGALAAVFSGWKYARHLALAAFAPVFAFLIYETALRYSIPGAAIVLSQALFEVVLFSGGVVLCVWLLRAKKI